VESAISLTLIVSIAMTPLSAAGQGRESKVWSGIRELEPGAEVTVRTPGSAPRTRYVIAADDAAVAFLNVSDPAVPPDVAKLLRRTAAKRPDYFVRLQLQSPEPATLFLDRRVSITPSGLFVGAKNIATLTQFVERIARADVERGAVQIEAGPSSDSDVAWSKVRQLAAGTPLTVTAKGRSASARYVLSVDDTTLRVLNTSTPGLSAEAAHMLRRAASEHPSAFVIGPRNSLMVDEQVVLGSSGLFVGNRKVADYTEIVQEIARADVENGVVLLGNAPVMRRMERPTKIVLAVAIPLAIIVVVGLCCVPRD
jgi:hypothetical protein